MIDVRRDSHQHPEPGWNEFKMSEKFFSTHYLSKEFGGIQALHALNFTVNQGEIHGVIGPNGAGKTTLINVITGIEKPSAGEVFFKGNRIDILSSQEIFKKGISRTFQDGKVVPNLTVLENILIGLSKPKKEKKAPRNIVSRWLDKITEENDIKRKGRDILEKVELQRLSERWADDLVWYERQLVQIARAIASEPNFLLLDEPTGGMGVDEKKLIEKKLKEINQSGVTIMLVSHDMQFIRSIAQRITVLDFGQKISEGRTEKVLTDPKVWEAYLGAEQ